MDAVCWWLPTAVPSQMQLLNSITWPAIRTRIAQAIDRLGAEGYKVCVVEAAILLEAGWQDLCGAA